MPPPLVSAASPAAASPGYAARELYRAGPLDRDALIAGLVGVLFLHLLGYFLTPKTAYLPAPTRLPALEVLRVELVPLELEDEPQLVRVNPAVEPETPPETLNMSNRDQVAAQEEVTPLSADESPAQEGDREDSSRLVQGDPYQEVAMPSTASSPTQATQPSPLQLPAPRQPPEVTAPDINEDEPVEDEALASRLDPADNTEIPEEDVELAEELNPIDVTSALDGTGQAQTLMPEQQAAQPSQQEPRPDRPRVALDNSRGPIRSSALGVGRIGRVAWNSRYSEFGEYWYRVTEVIERQWNNLVTNSLKSLTFDGSLVRFEITIRRDGSISDVRVLESNVSRQKELLALDAIESRAPFPVWTPDMIATMGESTTLSYGFIY